MALFRCGGGIPQKTLLWSNPSPNSAFAEQTITLNQPLNTFDWLLVEHVYWKGSITSHYSLWPNPTTYKVLSGGGYNFMCIGGWTATSYHYVRKLRIPENDTTWTKLYIAGGQRINNTSSDNSACIPLAIYGVTGLDINWLTA